MAPADRLILDFLNEIMARGAQHCFRYQNLKQKKRPDLSIYQAADAGSYTREQIIQFVTSETFRHYYVGRAVYDRLEIYGERNVPATYLAQELPKMVFASPLLDPKRLTALLTLPDGTEIADQQFAVTLRSLISAACDITTLNQTPKEFLENHSAVGSSQKFKRPIRANPILAFG